MAYLFYTKTRLILQPKVARNKVMICFYNKVKIQNWNIPTQYVPFPENPVLQVQKKFPGVFVHWPNLWHGAVLHSSMSTKG